MIREDDLDAMAYWHNLNPKVFGKVMEVDYASDKDHSSACIYCTLNPEGSEWIDFIKKKSTWMNVSKDWRLILIMACM